ncbi:MAG TPA: response regulator [Burkholderiales bacterium]|jgi:CheY-like chemotaxis protein
MPPQQKNEVRARIFELSIDETAQPLAARILAAGRFEGGGESMHFKNRVPVHGLSIRRFGRGMGLRTHNLPAGRRVFLGLPPKPAGPKESDRGGSADAKKVTHRVLVVEDNLDSLHTLVALLRFEGHTVEYAINGYAAMEIAEKFQPEVVLLDLGLPGANGYEVCRWLKLQPGMEGSRIIAVTGYGSAVDRAKSREAGCEHHVTKPYDLDKLLVLVRGESGKAR